MDANLKSKFLTHTDSEYNLHLVPLLTNLLCPQAIIEYEATFPEQATIYCKGTFPEHDLVS